MLRATSCTLDRASSLAGAPSWNALSLETLGLVRAPSRAVRSTSACSSPMVKPLASLPPPTTAAASRPQLPQRRQRVVAACSTSGQQGTRGAPGSVDPFIAASYRLQSMLAGCGDGEDEMVSSMVSDETPETRLQMQCALGGLLTVASVAVCTLSGTDPWGGAGLSMETAMAAGVGAGVALPLVMLRAWSWSSGASKVLPQLEDMHVAQLQLQSPWFSRSSSWHVMAMMALEVLPVTMLLLPAAQGGLEASVSMYTSMLHGLGGSADAHSEWVRIACLLLTASVAGLGKGLELGVSEQEYEVVQTAVDNADRYYRTTAGGSPNEGAGSSVAMAAKSALAFRSVAQAWMDTRNGASLASAFTSWFDVMCLGGLWYATGNLAAPLVASLAVNAVDYHHLWKSVKAKEARVDRGAQGRTAKLN